MSELDYVTKLRIEMAASSTADLLADVVTMEVDRLGGDKAALLHLSGALYEVALALGMMATKLSRQNAMDALYELGIMGLPKEDGR